MSAELEAVTHRHLFELGLLPPDWRCACGVTLADYLHPEPCAVTSTPVD